MEMRIKENIYWVLQTDEEITLYDMFRESVAKIKELMQNDKEPIEIELMEVELQGEKMMAKSVAWSEIASQLVKL